MAGDPRRGSAHARCRRVGSRPGRWRLTAKLSDAEADLLAGACGVAGVASTASWMRHVVFGDPLSMPRRQQDAMLDIELDRVGATLLIARDRITTMADQASRDRALLAVADLAAAVLRVQRHLRQDRDVPRGDGRPWTGDERRRSVACEATEGEWRRVREAADACGMSMAAWCGAALLEAGFPLSIQPICTANAVAAAAAVGYTVHEAIGKRGGDEVATALMTAADSLRDCLVKLVPSMPPEETTS